MLRIGDSREGRFTRRPPGDFEQAVLRSRTSAGREREVGRASALGRRWAVRDFFGRLGRHGHGARRDRKLYGKEIAQQIAESTEYEWQQDSTRDPFVRLLNKGDVGEVLRRMGRG